MKDDTISRQAVLDLLVRCAVPENGGSLLYYGIKQLPSAERHGRWLHLHLDPDNITGHTKGECSICGKLRIVDNYCPNCGAKMDGDEDIPMEYFENGGI